MKNFKYALAISGKRIELENIIIKLISLGYEWTAIDRNDYDRYPYLVTGYGQNICSMGFGHPAIGATIRAQISASNPDLVLALAAMVDDDKFYQGELCYWSGEEPMFLKIIKRCDVHNDSWVSDIKSHNSLSEYHLRKATKEEIINHFNMNSTKIAYPSWGEIVAQADIPKEDRKIIGYKLKDNCKQYEEAACKIGTVSYFTESSHGYFVPRSVVYDYLKEAGVLDLWFEPVYETKDKIVLVKCESGDFDVKVSGDSILYSGTELDVEGLRLLIKRQVMLSGFEVSFNKVDIGCKKGISLDSIREILKAYDHQS